MEIADCGCPTDSEFIYHRAECHRAVLKPKRTGISGPHCLDTANREFAADVYSVDPEDIPKGTFDCKSCTSLRERIRELEEEVNKWKCGGNDLMRKGGEG